MARLRVRLALVPVPGVVLAQVRLAVGVAPSRVLPAFVPLLVVARYAVMLAVDWRRCVTTFWSIPVVQAHYADCPGDSEWRVCRHSTGVHCGRSVVAGWSCCCDVCYHHDQYECCRCSRDCEIELPIFPTCFQQSSQCRRDNCCWWLADAGSSGRFG